MNGQMKRYYDQRKDLGLQSVPEMEPGVLYVALIGHRWFRVQLERHLYDGMVNVSLNLNLNFLFYFIFFKGECPARGSCSHRRSVAVAHLSDPQQVLRRSFARSRLPLARPARVQPGRICQQFCTQVSISKLSISLLTSFLTCFLQISSGWPFSGPGC